MLSVIFIVMLSAVMLNDTMLNVVMLSAIMLHITMPSLLTSFLKAPAPLSLFHK
jgi:hypothetical protein